MAETSVSITVDVSEALKGLKALRREVQAATQDFKELETKADKTIVPNDISNYTQQELIDRIMMLHKELSKFDNLAVKKISIQNKKTANVYANDKTVEYCISGPGHILIIAE